MLSAMVDLRRKQSDSLRLVAFLWRLRDWTQGEPKRWRWRATASTPARRLMAREGRFC